MKGKDKTAKYLWAKYPQHSGIVFCLLIIFYLSLLHDESYSQIIFPGLFGEELRDSLVAHYKTTFTLDYTAARDIMFGILDNYDDSVSCVYTGYTVYVDHNSSNPHTVAYNAGLNTEHTWPQSLGATGQARSDLHHLYPTKINVNSDRGSLPFAFIPDIQVDRWYRLDQVLTVPPTQFVEEYSKVDLGVEFEPREDHKGNAARTIFYFYTMYQAQANDNFFQVQKDILRLWNSLDPPNTREMQRNDMIASYQDGKKNPFILDTTLIGRAYFGVTSVASSKLEQEPVNNFMMLSNYPNPFNSRTVISFNLPVTGNIELKIYNLRGQSIYHRSAENLVAGRQKVRLELNDLPSGVYFVNLMFNKCSYMHKIILLR